MDRPGEEATQTVVLDDGAPDGLDGASDGPEPWDDAALRPGDRVGRYRLVDRLGEGGMGVVWRAHDPRLERTVAVKVLHEPRRRRREDEARERLRREALALAQLSHPNVVAIYDVGEHGRRVFLAVERELGRHEDAVAHLRRAVSLTEAGPLGEAFRAEARLALARV